MFTNIQDIFNLKLIDFLLFKIYFKNVCTCIWIYIFNLAFFTSFQIVQRAHKGRYVKKIIPKVQQESIFTEEDFRKFEEEYFNS